MNETSDEPEEGEPAMLNGAPRDQGRRKATPDAAFDIWLRRGLHTMFDEIAREPIPEELLRLIRPSVTE